MAIEPDTKDWTWVLERPCPECGMDAATVTPADLPVRLHQAGRRWQAVLERADAKQRPDAGTWAPLEYAAHTRDLCGVLMRRLAQVRTREGPTFPDWDQDAAAEGYLAADPAEVSAEVVGALQAAGRAFGSVPAAQWGRRGMRGDGKPFTVQSLAQYFLHDVEHHLHDVDG